MKCKAGTKRNYVQKITIQRLAGTADAAGHVDGQIDANWTVYAGSWAAVETRGGREFWKIQQVNADVDSVWYLPWSPALDKTTPDMRIQHEGKVYEILSVQNLNLENREIEIQTRRKM